MASNEGHIHWTGVASDTVTYLNQELQLTSERSNLATAVMNDPIGMARIRAVGFSGTGLALPTEGWQVIPGTSPILEARVDAFYPTGLVRIRQQ